VKIEKILLAVILFVVISEIIHTAESFLTMNFYTDPNYFAVWSKVMMSTAGPPPVSFYYYSIVFTFISGLIFVYVYTLVKSVIKAKVNWQIGARYGIGIWVVAGIPWTLTTYLLINLPPFLLIYWNISSLIVYVLAGIVAAKILK